jgi:hypothetical protein
LIFAANLKNKLNESFRPATESLGGNTVFDCRGRFDQFDAAFGAHPTHDIRGQWSVMKVFTCERWPILTGAGALELCGVATRMTRRAFEMIAWETAHLAVIVIQERAVGIDGRSADHGEVDLELADEIHRRFADHRAVGAPAPRRRRARPPRPDRAA